MKSLLLIPLVAAPCLAQESDEDLLEGHSGHGEVFNDGPRQAAYLMEGTGNVDFPVTAANDTVQAFFNQGVGQLHGFWFFEAERTFRHIADLDPDCPMAFWGMAMANVDNEDRAAGFARVAWLKRGLATKREQMYIDALASFHGVDGAEEPKRLIELREKREKEAEEEDEEADEDEEEPPAELSDKEKEKRKKEYEARQKKRKSAATQLVKDYEEIIWKYPDDIEAKAILVNRLWLNQRFGIPTPSRHANNALLEQVFAKQPSHPAHHYRIHLWDAEDSAEQVVDSAVKSGLSNPGIAHMWHMGGHIFAQLGRHTDAAWQQEASARVDHAHMIRDRVLPDQIHNFAHNNEWLTRSMRHHGRVRDAVALAKNMIELPRHPRYNMVDRGGCSASYGRRRLLETLELFEQWDELVALSQTMYLEPSDEAMDRVQRAYLLGKAHAYRGDFESCEEQVAVLEDLLAEVKTDRITSLEEAEDEALEAEKSKTEMREAMEAVLDEYARDLDGLRDKIEALGALRAVFDEEDVKDNLELLKKRGFSTLHLSRLWLEAGFEEEAVEMARKACEKKDGQLYPHAALAHVLYSTGETEEALELFDELREWTALADLDMPVFQRLAPLAEARGLPADWRVEPTIPEDVGERPDIATLGPVHWTPPVAPDWSAEDGFGNRVTLADYSERPVIVIFFLGFGCVHCVEQLQAFGPATGEFTEAGIDIVAIGTDTLEELNESQKDDTEDTAYPFQILADPDLDLFKLYRAHDDFEGMPLHGTFLIDTAGRIRWQDISYEPFMEWEFLLEESQRLLGLPVHGDEARANAGASATSAGARTGSASGTR